MNGIDKIIGRISGDAQAEIDAILAQANAEAVDIAAQYEAQGKAEADAILARGEKSAAERGERMASVAQLECRKANLAAKQEVLDKAFEAAKQKLLALPQDQYIALLADLAVQASSTGRSSSSSPRRTGREWQGRGHGGQREAGEGRGSSAARRGHRHPAGAILNKVVTGASAVLNGTAMLTLSEETRPMEGGFILSSGYTEVNCTFGTLIRLQRDTLAAEVAKVLFD